MLTQLLQTLDLLGAAHGTLVGLWLLHSAWRHRNASRAWLALFLLSFSLELLNSALLDYPAAGIDVQPWGLPINGYYLLPLALWVYGMSLLRPGYRLPWVWWLLPVAEVVLLASMLGLPPAQRQTFLDTEVGAILGLTYILGGLLLLPFWLGRLLWALHTTAREAPPGTDPEAFRLQRQWLRTLCLLLAGNLLLWLVSNLMPSLPPAADPFYILNTLLTTGLVYHISIRTLVNSQLSVALQVRPQPASHLPPADAAAAWVQILVDQKLYLDPDLTLDKLARSLGVHPRTLSLGINAHLGKGVVPLINELRVAEAKRLLADEAQDHLTIVWLAEQSGFAAKSTFNVVFKQLTGMTPSQYRQSLRQSRQSA